jgi:hypothetical protein
MCFTRSSVIALEEHGLPLQGIRIAGDQEQHQNVYPLTSI